MKRTYSEQNDEKQQQHKHSQKQNNDADPKTGDNTANPPKKTNSWADMGKTARKTARQRIEERSAAADYTSSPVTTIEPHAQDMEGDQDHNGQIEIADYSEGTESSESAGDTNTSDKKALIRALNDQLRTTCEGGIILMTEGITSLEPEILNQCMMKIQGEQVFNEDNDPYGEHDFGSIKHEDIVVFWKTDYYDLDMLHHSPDPTDEHVTKRVLTIMLASEY